ncbi:hypothetical protein Sa4125_23600 [Aureimonas sp. SA4125]|nr:hypothetical protein Sa4125_23600 [Aureimonas sp. SA4125]
MDQTVAPTLPEIIAEKRHSTWHKFRIWLRTRNALHNARFGEDAFADFEAGVTGSYPREGGGGIILAACDDLYYWRFAITLLLSIEDQGEHQQVHLHLCRPSAETLRHIRGLPALLNHVELTWTADECRLAERLQFRTVYLASARFLIAAVVMREAKAPILCIDVDAIAVKPVWPAYAEVQQRGDAVLIQRTEERSVSRRLRAGAVGFNPTPAGQRYVSAVGRSITSIFAIRPRYHLDQIVLYYLMRDMKKREQLSVADMPGPLSDFDFTSDAVIWMAKGWAVKNSDQYGDAKRAVDARFPQVTQSPFPTDAPIGLSDPGSHVRSDGRSTPPEPRIYSTK